MKLEMTSEDIIRRRHYADLAEWGDFYAESVELPEDLEETASLREFRVHGTWRRWFLDAENPDSERVDDPIETEAALDITLFDPIPIEEVKKMTAGELFSCGWDEYQIVC